MFGCAAWDVRDLGVLGPVCVSSGRFAGVRGAGAVSVPACLLMPGGVTGAVSPTSSSDITTAVSGCVFCVCDACGGVSNNGVAGAAGMSGVSGIAGCFLLLGVLLLFVLRTGVLTAGRLSCSCVSPKCLLVD